MKCFCAARVRPGMFVERTIKVTWTDRESIMWWPESHSPWQPSRIDSLLTPKYQCDECKHKLMCLVDPHAQIVFESK